MTEGEEAEAPHTPLRARPGPGDVVHDSVLGRVGQVLGQVARAGSCRLLLRPLGPGPAWEADPDLLRTLGRAELLRALVAEANARSRRPL
ncbi:hypothetical protein ACFV3R_19455 [Streptomyces sp. NPDC059740]|uniref:hypothetical protein n=1 Tax=Streptomyces sp. NPDC059740 TaxID=3346926 RepID=UPI003653CEF8